jgi:hypothetical protein
MGGIPARLSVSHLRNDGKDWNVGLRANPTSSQSGKHDCDALWLVEMLAGAADQTRRISMMMSTTTTMNTITPPPMNTVEPPFCNLASRQA